MSAEKVSAKGEQRVDGGGKREVKMKAEKSKKKATVSLSRVRVSQVRSAIGSRVFQRRTLQALGLRRLHASVEHKQTPAIKGMLACVAHLIKVEPLS